MLAWRHFYGERVPAPVDAFVDQVRKVQSENAVDVRGDELAGPDCFAGGEGYIIYDDDKGTSHIVESPAQVPARFRAKARCSSVKR